MTRKNQLKFMIGWCNRPFLIYFVPLFQNESSWKPFTFENESDLHENKPVRWEHFHMNGFTQRLILARGKRQLGSGLLDICMITLQLRTQTRCFKSQTNQKQDICHNIDVCFSDLLWKFELKCEQSQETLLNCVDTKCACSYNK